LVDAEDSTTIGVPASVVSIDLTFAKW